MGWGLKLPFPLVLNMTASNLSVDTTLFQQHGEQFAVRATVKNVGPRAGRYVAQIYGLTDGDNFPIRVLLGFKPIDLEHGQSKAVDFTCSIRPLQRWKDGTFVLTSKEFGLEFASCSGDERALRTQLRL